MLKCQQIVDIHKKGMQFMKNTDIERMKKEFYNKQEEGPRVNQPKRTPPPPKEEKEERKERPRPRPQPKPQKRRRCKKKHPIRNLLILILILIILLIVFVYQEVNNNINQYNLDSSKMEVNDVILSNLRKETKGYLTLAFFGVDSRIDKLDTGTRTDSIILLNINTKTGETKMLSVYRDTYLNTGNNHYNKVNAAYAMGGPEKALSTLNLNLDLNIENYVTVGFAGLAVAIDELGGITIKVDEDEIDYINAYQKTMTKQLKKKYKAVKKSGSQTLNGIQAVSYCRIRYTAGSDYKRTQRQRTVLAQMIAKAKKSSPFKLKRAGEAALRGIQTSMSTSQIMRLIPVALKCKIIDSDGMPFEKYRTTANLGSKGDCVLPKDLTDNVTKLHQFLYGTKDYEPSNTVKGYSEHIRSVLP